MAIKGLKEALAKKRAQQQPAANTDGTTDTAVPTAPQRPTSNRPTKRAAGRGR
jgi:hypothetical protein